MKILAIDTSCDETAAAVTEGRKVLSNVRWTQVSLHQEWGGVVPSLARTAHAERIDWVINQALKRAGVSWKEIEAVAVTAGPGLAIALEVGIRKARELALKYGLPLVAVNHVEGHLLSVLARPKTKEGEVKLKFPAIGLVASGKHADVILVEGVGRYKVVAHTIDDAVGEALDKAARMLGLGYPGGAILEKMAKLGEASKYELPTPMLGREGRGEFSYSGLKTAMWRIVEELKKENSAGVLTRQQIYDLAASFQNKAFLHLERILNRVFEKYEVDDFLVGGGVSANMELRKRLRKLSRDKNMIMHLPYSSALCGDNAAMIGVVASFKLSKGEFLRGEKMDYVDRTARAKIDESFEWETRRV